MIKVKNEQSRGDKKEQRVTKMEIYQGDTIRKNGDRI